MIFQELSEYHYAVICLSKKEIERLQMLLNNTEDEDNYIEDLRIAFNDLNP